MSVVILPAPGMGERARAICQHLCPHLDGAAEVGACEVRQFPDGEHYVRIDTAVEGREVAIACTLDRPEQRILPLLFLAATARDLGASRVGLIAPYLAFMRQDHAFRPGEGVTSRHFAGLLSAAVDWLVTVDPHLHRYRSLDDLYTVPSRVVHAAPGIAAWIRDHVSDPVLIGPDAESRQWVSAVAELAEAPYLVLDKIRRGDRDVEVSRPDAAACRGRNPVLIDDIISTGRTLIEPIGHLLRAGLPAPVCIGVHAVFADRAFDELRAAGAASIVTCDTIDHPSNAIAMDRPLADAVHELVGHPSRERPPHE